MVFQYQPRLPGLKQHGTILGAVLYIEVARVVVYVLSVLWKVEQPFWWGEVIEEGWGGQNPNNSGSKTPHTLNCQVEIYQQWWSRAFEMQLKHITCNQRWQIIRMKKLLRPKHVTNRMLNISPIHEKFFPRYASKKFWSVENCDSEEYWGSLEGN